MKVTADCIVAGGGLVGLLTALELAGSGVRVTLVERGQVGRESSWAGGGILSPLYPWRYPEGVTALARWSQARYPDLAARVLEATGVDPEWEPSGLLVLEAGERGLAEAWSGIGGVPVRAVAGNELPELEPSLAPGWREGLWLPSVAQIRNPRLARGLRLLAVASGVTVREGCPVLGVEHSGGRVAGVRTGDGPLAADAVVVSGGAWTRGLLGPLGQGIEVAPVRGQMILFHGPPGLVRRIVLAADRYLVPRRDGRVLAGSTLEHVGFDRSTTTEARQGLEAAARRLVPALATCPVEQHWAGLRPGSPQGLPYIGEHPEISGLYVNAGHFRNGVVLAPASARLLVDLMLRRPPAVEPSPYRWPTAGQTGIGPALDSPPEPAPPPPG
jgi:glycine oxidase